MGKTILAIILGAVSHFILGFLIYGLLLMDYMESNTVEYEGLMSEEPPLVGYAISSFFYAWLLTYILNRVRVKSAVDGLITGGVVTFLFGASLNIIFYYAMNLHTTSYLLVDLVAFTVMGAITGTVIGAFLSRGRVPVA